MLIQEHEPHEKFLVMEKQYPNVQFMPCAFTDSQCNFQDPVKSDKNEKIRNCDIGANTYVASNSLDLAAAF